MKDYKKNVVHQIYPKSFYDTNNDGHGDLKGVTAKLDYLKELGIDYIWLTPFFVSPQKDNGYDIADYKKIDHRYGTMEDFVELVREAEIRGIKVMLDLVLNHTSSDHEWFKKALAGDQKYRDYYFFRTTKDENPPTNWRSFFGGSTWEKIEGTDEFYLHLFDKTQPDLNWDNKNVRNDIYDIVNFWIERGAKGFRLDVINLISKPAEFVDDLEYDGIRFVVDGPNVHKYLKELNSKTFGKGEGLITVGEMSSSVEECIRYTHPNEKELSMVFNFHHFDTDTINGEKFSISDIDFMRFKNIIDSRQKGMQEGGGWNALCLCNHDQTRFISRLGDTKGYHKEATKMLATLTHLLSGTPYIYQGEEIGMTNPKLERLEDYRDVETLNYYEILKEKKMPEKEIMKIFAAKSRDNSRTPVQWDDSVNAGFSKGTSWINVGKNYKEINAQQALANQESIFYHYKNLIKLRKKHDIISLGTYESFALDHKSVYAYLRVLDGQKLLVLNNFYPTNTHLELDDILSGDVTKYEIIISNYKDSIIDTNTISLRPYESLAILIK